MMKKLLFLLMALFLSLSVVQATEYYKFYKPNFLGEEVSSFYVQGGVCSDSSCSSISDGITLLNADRALSCIDDYKNDGDLVVLESCLSSSEISGDVISLGSSGLIATKERVSSFKSIIHFYPSGDSYIPAFFKTTSYPSTCSSGSSICIDSNIYSIPFTKVENAIAEIGQINVVNLDDPLKPVQVSVPVSIDETVCSAYRYSNNYWKPSFIPSGFSDYSADTLISLNITRVSNSQLLHQESIRIPIEAENCASLNAFTWTPQSFLENERVKFEVTTNVVDNQVLNSLEDYASVEETIYPLDLDGSCWSRAYDFTLSNVRNFDLNTGVAQISMGESLFAGFRGGAWRDNSVTPMNFKAELFFDNGVDDPFSIVNYHTTPSPEPSEYFEDISSLSRTLPAGEYEVRLVTTPDGPNCDISEDSVLTQRLTILEPESYDVNVFVVDSDSNPIEGVNVALSLVSARDYVEGASYSSSFLTSTDGSGSFVNLIPGDYRITLSKDGFSTIVQDVSVLSDLNLYYTLTMDSSGPVIDLPEEFVSYYEDDLVIDLDDYISDFDTPNDLLNVSVDVSGEGISSSFSSATNVLVLSATQPSSGSLNVRVVDDSGLEASDSARIIFNDNSAPRIYSFRAQPDNGNAPLSTLLVVSVGDRDDDALTCSIDFDDGSQSYSGNCMNIPHTYRDVGTYTPRLTVSDGITSVEVTTNVYVFETQQDVPRILDFSFDSSNGNYVPTNLVFNWRVEHDVAGTPMTCNLRINSEVFPVSCDSESFDYGEYTRPGTANFVLSVSDGEYEDSRVLNPYFFVNDQEPDVISFLATPDSGRAPLDVVFTYSIRDNEDSISDLNCRIDFGDGFAEEDSCSILSGISHVYTQPNTYLPRLRITDSAGNVVDAYEMVVVYDRVDNLDPRVLEFNVNPQTGFSPLDVLMNWRVVDPENDPTSCSLTYLGVTRNVSCDGSDSTTFNAPGTYPVTLRAVDDLGGSVEVTRLVEVIDYYAGGPVIDSFSVSTDDGNYVVPNDIYLNYIVSHTLGDNNLTCTFSDSVNELVSPCSSGSVLVSDFNLTGLLPFTLTVRDSVGREVSQTLFYEFYGLNDVDLSLDEVDLDIESPINPGPFDFSISVLNESLFERVMEVSPKVICRGVTYSLSKELSTRAISREDNQGLRFVFNTDTQDFNGNIPTDVSCLFKVRVVDKFGTNIDLVKSVVFSYSKRSVGITSIRGEGTDVVNYMQSTFADNFLPGYNLVVFSVVNNEDFTKEMSISAISREAGININERFKLAPYERKEIQLPFEFKDGVVGRYPIRISVNDGEDVLTRYSYIRISN